MPPTEKRAWILLGLFLVVFPLWMTLALTDPGLMEEHRLLGYDRPAAMWVAQIGTIMAAAVALAFRRKQGRLEVAEDERDREIGRTALVTASHASLVSLVVACLGVLLVFKRLRSSEMIPLDVLVTVVTLAGVVWYLTLTIATLVSYRRGN